MNENNTCKETFLEDLVSVSVYDLSQCEIPVPFNVPFVRSVVITVTGEPIIHISYQENGCARAQDDSITAKYSSAIQNAGRAYSVEMAATIVEGFDNVEVAVQKNHSSCVAVLEKTDGTHLLVYAVPNTLVLSATDNVSAGRTMNLAIKAQAVSPYIEIINMTIK